MDSFLKDSTTGEELLTRPPQEEPGKMMTELQKYLLGSLKDESQVGIYSTMHVGLTIVFSFVRLMTHGLLPGSRHLRARLFCPVN